MLGFSRLALAFCLIVGSAGPIIAQGPPVDLDSFPPPAPSSELTFREPHQIFEAPPVQPATPIRSAPQKRPERQIFSGSFETRWEPETGGFETREYEARANIALFPIFGPPPPILRFEVGRTDLDGFGLPELYTLTFGLNWIRPVNDRWAWMFGIAPSLATDFENTSSEAWQFRGNAFAFYTPRDDLQWIFGAVVTGRRDLPAIPAVGLVWWPTERSRLDLTFPRPRYSHRLVDTDNSEWWGYLGVNLGGGTWAVELPGGTDTELTYRAWRFVVGIESVAPGTRRPGARGGFAGTGTFLEAGFSVGREIEFENTDATIDPDSVIYIGAGIRF